MSTLNKKELIIGVAMLVASIGYMAMSYQLPGHAGVDAATLPVLLSGLLLLLGVMQVLGAFASKTAVTNEAPSQDDSSETAAPAIVEPRTVFKTLGLILAYMALLGPVGFPIMTALYLYLQFIVLTPVNQKVRHLTYALIAVISSAVIFLLFREAFDLLLPAGLLNDFL
ncbi:tripartite tricarboxylate transporter TctB family protein [Pseudomonas sp. NCHU5208]|uniref:tripartite tricarboxylate transporter TctB family protein n=1 Tax=unclassified Pseudomonas TaxID=196821 RepID=UPI003F947FF7